VLWPKWIQGPFGQQSGTLLLHYQAMPVVHPSLLLFIDLLLLWRLLLLLMMIAEANVPSLVHFALVKHYLLAHSFWPAKLDLARCNLTSFSTFSLCSDGNWKLFATDAISRYENALVCPRLYSWFFLGGKEGRKRMKRRKRKMERMAEKIFRRKREGGNQTHAFSFQF